MRAPSEWVPALAGSMLAVGCCHAQFRLLVGQANAIIGEDEDWRCSEQALLHWAWDTPTVGLFQQPGSVTGLWRGRQTRAL